MVVLVVEEVVFLAVGTPLLLMNAAVAAIQVRTHAREWAVAFLSGLQSSLQAGARLVMRHWGPGGGGDDESSDGSKDALEKLVDRRISETAQRKMWSLMCALGALHCLTTTAISLTILAGQPRRASKGVMFRTIAGLGVYTLLRLWRVRMGQPQPVVIFHVIMIHACVTALVAPPDTAAFLLTEVTMFVVRCAAGARIYRMREVSLWNVAYFGAAVFTYRRQFANRALHFAIAQAWISGVVILSSAWAKHTVYADTRREIEAEVLKGEASGLWRLLEIVCDVVVPLDSTFRIMKGDGCSRFAAMVMRRNTAGARLQDFMAGDGDREAFELCMGSSQSEETLEEGRRPRVVHVRFRDSMDNVIGVEVFCVPVKTLGGEGHFIGLREFSDHAPIPECRRFRRVRPARASAAATSRRPPTAPAVAATASGSAAPTGWAGGLGDIVSEGSSSASPAEGSSEQSCGGGSGGSSPAHSETPVPSAAMETPDETAQLALLQVMLSCSPGGPTRRACCHFHYRSAFLLRNLLELHKLACRPRFGPGCSARCRVCHFMINPNLPSEPSVSVPGQRCFACRSPLDDPLGPPPPQGANSVRTSL